MKKPNLIFFVSDHFRKEALHHMGNEASATPNLDMFVQEDAVSFAHAFCQNPVCVPSRCSFLSGLYPHVKGFRTMHHLQSQDDFNLLTQLKKEGYHIYFGGKNDVFRNDVPLSSYCDYRSNAYSEMEALATGKPLKEGYHSVLHNFTKDQAQEAMLTKEVSRRECDSKYYYSLYQGIVTGNNPLAVGYVGAEDAQIQDALNYLETYDKEVPLCMYLSLILPHPHYAITRDDFDAINRDKLEPCIRLNDEQRGLKPSILAGMRENFKLHQWSDEALLDFKQTYLALVHHSDSNFGKVMGMAKQTGIYDNTAIFMFSDHGDYAGEFEIAEINQNTFDDILTNVPLLIKPPKGVSIKPGIRNGLVELVDLPVTVADIIGFDLPESHFGRSLCHLFTTDEVHKEAVFCEGGRLEDEAHCIDGGHMKSNLYWARTSVQERMPEHTKAIMIRNENYKYVYRYYENHECYDLQKDPHEMNNVIHDPQYHEVIQNLQMRLLQHFVTSCDSVPNRRDER